MALIQHTDFSYLWQRSPNLSGLHSHLLDFIIGSGAWAGLARYRKAPRENFQERESRGLQSFKDGPGNGHREPSPALLVKRVTNEIPLFISKILLLPQENGAWIAGLTCCPFGTCLRRAWQECEQCFKPMWNKQHVTWKAGLWPLLYPGELTRTPMHGIQTQGLPAWAPVFLGATSSGGLHTHWKAVERMKEDDLLTISSWCYHSTSPLQQRSEGPGRATFQPLCLTRAWRWGWVPGRLFPSTRSSQKCSLSQNLLNPPPLLKRERQLIFPLSTLELMSGIGLPQSGLWDEVSRART